MDFFGFEDTFKEEPKKSSEDSLSDEVSSVDSSFDKESLSFHLSKAKEEVLKAKAVFSGIMHNEVLEKSKDRWLEEKDFDPMLLKKRGYLNKELDEAFFDSLPKVHPEVKFAVNSNPNNQLVIKQIRELEKILNSINLTF